MAPQHEKERRGVWLGSSMKLFEMGNLPEELMMEILKRLPSESVGRFKCVSKYWYALINDPKFADSLQHPSLLVKLTVNKNEESGEKQTMLTSLKFPLASAAVVDMDLPLSDHFENCEFRGGYSRGLICLSNMLGNIYLCNPATGELRKLPPSILLTEPPEDPFDRNGTSMNGIGFGYDPKSMDFKVVRVVEFEEDEYRCYRTEVYDLGKDDWREIESRACGFAAPEFSFDMYHQGMYYWIATKEEDEGGSEIIQWFDMSEEVFGCIPLPQGFVNDTDKCISLCVWKGQIVLLLYNPLFSETTFEIWAMEKNDFNLWAKVFTIDPISGIERPLVFVSSDELVMVTKEGQLILYNLNSKLIVQLPIKGLPHTLEVTVFIKTLLSVG